jgi:hypothetical protein
MRLNRWWHYGLLGGTFLTVATIVRIARRLPRLETGELDWTELLALPALVFAMGFLCGTVGWASRGISRRFGLLGDAFVGATVMVVFFLCCMLIFARELLTANPVGALLMLAFGGGVGLLGGVLIGYEVRKGREKQERSQRQAVSDDNPFADE